MTHAEATQRIKQSGIVGPAHGNLERVKTLVEKNPLLIDAMNAVDASMVDKTPQGAAAHTQSGAIVRFLHEKGVKLDIFMASAMGLPEDVSTFLRNDPALATARGAHGIPLIAHAANKVTAAAMLDNGVTCDIFMAATFGLAEHVSALLRSEPALKNVRNAQGVAPMQLAAMVGHKDVVKALLDAGADDHGDAGRQFLEGESTKDADWQRHYFHKMNLQASAFNNINLGQCVIHNANMKGTIFMNVNLTDAIIDWATLDGLKIRGVEVKPLIEAELKKRG